MRFLLLIVALWLALLSSTIAADWPQFRGPGGSGVVAESSVPTEWGPEKNIKWQVEVPGVAWSQPIVVGDKIFVTTAITENQRKPSVGGGFGGPGGGGSAPRGFPPGGPGGAGGTQRGPQENPPANNNNDGGFRRATDGPRPEGNAPREQPAPRAEGAQPQGQQAQAEQPQPPPGGQRGNGDRPPNRGGGGFGDGGFGRGGFGGGGGGFGRGGQPPNAVYQWKLLCLDRSTGKVLWEQLAHEGKPTIPTQPQNTYASETPVSDGERVYAYFGMTGLFCYDLDGKLLWSRNLGSFPMTGGWGTASSPALDSERLFIQCDNEEKSFLVALDKRTGDELWRVARDEKTSWCTPYIWKNKLRTELVTSGNKVRSYDPADGKLLWEFGNIGGQCKATPVGDAELLYVGNGGRGGGMPGGFGRGGFGGPPGGGRGGPGGNAADGARPGGDAPGAAPGGGRPANSPLIAIKAGAAGDLSLADKETSNTGVAWSIERAGPPTASPLVYQGCVYVLEQGSGLVGCYDAKTGKQHYRQRVPDAGSFTSSPWAADGKIFCLDQDGRTTILQAGPELKVLGANKLNDMFWSSAAVAKGDLLLRGVDRLYCIAQR